MIKLTRILAIESSCDETSAAVVEYVDKFEIKSNITNVINDIVSCVYH